MKLPDRIDNNILALPYQCKWGTCTKGFKRNYDLQRHSVVHTKAKPFSCTFPGCGKSFTQMSALKRHSVVHTKAKPFPCTVRGCEKRFTQKYAATSHVRKHTGEKAYQCQQTGCGKQFSSRSSLARHRRTAQTKNPRHQCSFDGCFESFCNNAILLEHQRQLHQQEMKPRNIDDSSSASNDQEIPDLQPSSITGSLDDIFSISQPDPKYLLNHGTLYQNYESQVHGCHFPSHQYHEYDIPFYETGYPHMDGVVLEEVESPGMEIYATDGTPVWSQSCITPFNGPSSSSWTAQGGFFSPGTLPMHPVAEGQAGMLQYQQPMQSHMVYPSQEQWPPYEFLAF